MHVRAERFGTPTAGRVRTRALAAGGVAGVAGAVAGWLIPRGPVTTSEALVAVGTTLAVGFASGWLMRSRWAMVLAPAVFMLAFELARMRVDGPTVDGVRVDNLYGVLMLVAGRGVDAVLMLLPMMVGVSYGVRIGESTPGTTGSEQRPPLGASRVPCAHHVGRRRPGGRPRAARLDRADRWGGW